MSQSSFGFNELVVEAAARDDRIRAGLWVSPRPQDAELDREGAQRWPANPASGR